jgi:hypothetical protein
MQKEDFLADEVLIIEESGEMPEVAYHGAVYYLTRDPDGPGLTLEEKDHTPLKNAVVSRYTTIMMRDLTPDNRSKSIYRGLERCICNWQRLKLYSEREKINISHIRKKTARRLTHFLQTERDDVIDQKCPTSINCSKEDLENFIRDLGLEPSEVMIDCLKMCMK